MAGLSRLTWAQALCARLLTDTAVLLRATSTPDGSGGTTRAITSLGPYPCRLRSLTTLPVEGSQAGRIVAVSVWVLYLPPGTVVLPADQVQVNGVTFEVLEGNTARTDPVYQAVNLREVH